MVTRSMSKLAAAAGGLALVALAGAGIASADGLSQQAIDTTCNKGQVMAALRAISPADATKLGSSGRANFFLDQYLGAPAGSPQRISLANQAQTLDPATAQQYIPLINRVVANCNNY
jgi:hypothetical protein